MKYDVTPEVTALIGGGAGVVAGYSTPDFRVLAGLRFAPRPGTDSGPLDTDDDGLYDPADRCPELPEDRDGFEDDDGCPDPDNDGDAILDADDRCPMEPEDVDTYQDDDGCPDPDNDGDGVRDSDDKCPLQAGVPEADGCPADDRDQDGIKNAQDICPDDPEDKDNFQDDDGCPDEDNDDDGVLDVDDKCPLSPEDREGFEDEDGCPDIDNDKDGFKDVDDKCPMEPRDHQRHQGRRRVSRRGQDQGHHPQGPHRYSREGLLRHQQSGHSASLVQPARTGRDRSAHQPDESPRFASKDTPTRAAPMHITSTCRTAAPKPCGPTWSKPGIEPNRMIGRGFGEVSPIATNDTSAGREQNRRVEFKIVEMNGEAVDATTEVKGETEVIEVD